MEANGSVGSRDRITARLQNVPQLECYLMGSKNKSLDDKELRMRTLRGKFRLLDHQQGWLVA